MSPRTYSRTPPAASNFWRICATPVRAILPAMSRRLGLVTLLLATVLAAGCSGGDDNAGTTTGADTGATTVAAPSTTKITLRAGRTNTGPWVDPWRSSTARTESRPTSSSAPPGTRPCPRGVRCSGRGHAAGRHGPPARAAPGGSCGRKPGQSRLGNRRNLRCRRARSPAERLRLRPGRRRGHVSRHVAPSRRRRRAGDVEPDHGHLVP